MNKFAFIAYDDFAIWQVALLQKFLKDKSWKMETFSIDGSNVSTDGGIVINVEKSIETEDPNEYDLILLPGGNVTSSLIENQPLRTFLRCYKGNIAANCASAVLLAASGLINGKYTCMPQTNDQYSHLFRNGNYDGSDVCIYKNIITSKGPDIMNL
ncbi:DJ-1/PfpI family protein [Bacillus gobiensis]|uniref:DJ-1/PfpI family protein n=1 Tax=Bacillus gobiensis TaxID=1441095 RepID=UPI003D243F47